MAHLLVDLGIDALGQLNRDGHRRVLCLKPRYYMGLQIWTLIKHRNLGSLSHGNRTSFSTPCPILLSATIAVNLSADRAAMPPQVTGDLNNGTAASDPETDLLSFAQ